MHKYYVDPVETRHDGWGRECDHEKPGAWRRIVLGHGAPSSRDQQLRMLWGRGQCVPRMRQLYRCKQNIAQRQVWLNASRTLRLIFVLLNTDQNNYALRQLYKFVNACEKYGDAGLIIAEIEQSCELTGMTGIHWHHFEAPSTPVT